MITKYPAFISQPAQCQIYLLWILRSMSYLLSRKFSLHMRVFCGSRFDCRWRLLGTAECCCNSPVFSKGIRNKENLMFFERWRNRWMEKLRWNSYGTNKSQTTFSYKIHVLLKTDNRYSIHAAIYYCRFNTNADDV